MQVKINIKYSTPEEDILEIGFYRGDTLLHNVFYDIEGLSEAELLELKQEAAAKFAAIFPEIPLKDVMKGFSSVDDKMYALYQETFNPKGAGRKKGVKIGKIKPPTVCYHRRVPPEFVPLLDELLEKLKKEN